MPPAVAVIAAAGLFAVGGSLSAIAASLAVTLLTNVVLGELTKALTKKPKQFSPAVNVTVRNSIDNRRIVFGTRRCGGSFAFINTSSISGSTLNNLLWFVVVLADHEVQSIGDIYLDNELCPSGSINPSTGNVASPTKFNGKLKIFKFLGTSSQAVHPDLDAAFTEITSDFRLRGCAYLLLQLTRDDTAFPNGAPRDITAIVSGLKLYDPRKDSTNGGSGSHRASNPSTWQFSENPALMARWYLSGGSVVNTGETTRLIKYGMKEGDSRIDDAYTIAAANVCDELLTGAEDDPNQGLDNSVRFFAGLEATTGQTHRTVLQDLLDAMAGTMTYVQGKWRISAGAYETPLHSFTQEDLYGDLEVSDTSDGDDRYNAVSAVFFDRLGSYAEATTIFRTDAAYETQDGGERLTREIDLRAVTDQYVAQRLAEIQLRKSRMMRTIKITGALNLLKVAPNETFALSHERYGWTNRVFRCMERQFEFNEEAGRVVITAQAENAAVYNDLLTADYTTGISATDEFKREVPYAPTSLTTSTQALSLNIIVGLPASFPDGAVVQLFEHTASTPFSSATLIQQGRTGVFGVPKRDQTTRFYWARIKAQDGGLSDTFPASTGTGGVASYAQTTDIATGAATDTYLSTQPSFQAGPVSNAPYYVVDSVQFSAETYAYTAIVTFTANMYESPVATPNSFICILRSLAGPTGGSPPSGSGGGIILGGTRINSSTSIGSLFTIRGQYDVPIGDALNVRVQIQALNSGVTLFGSNAVFQVERIKR